MLDKENMLWNWVMMWKVLRASSAVEMGTALLHGIADRSQEISALMMVSLPLGHCLRIITLYLLLPEMFSGDMCPHLYQMMSIHHYNDWTYSCRCAKFSAENFTFRIYNFAVRWIRRNTDRCSVLRAMSQWFVLCFVFRRSLVSIPAWKFAILVDNLCPSDEHCHSISQQNTKVKKCPINQHLFSLHERSWKCKFLSWS
jgi:hypothetical protein